MAQTSSMQNQPNSAGSTGASSFLKTDFPVIRSTAVTFSIVLALSIVLVGGSRTLLSKQLDGKNQAMAKRDQVRAQYEQAETEKLEIREFQPKYLRLRERGFSGEENRLSWIEAIQDIQKNRQLLPVSYEIAAQQAFQVAPSMLSGGLELKGSKMSVRMKLWHEMDLFNLLDDLAGKGLYAPTECSLVRNGGNAENPSPSGLDAECRLYWLTLRMPGANEVDTRNLVAK